MWGAAWQAGALPMSRAAIEAAIRLNGAEVATNLRAFNIGRAYIAGRLEPEKTEETLVSISTPLSKPVSPT